MSTSTNIDDFIIASIHNLDKTSGKKTEERGEGDLNYFENYFKKYGKELDERFRFLMDIDVSDTSESSPYTTINEIKVGFNKSKLLFTPQQFAYMTLHNNVYIENPKPGEWLQFTANNIEEGLINLKDKNKRNNEDTVTHVLQITEKIPR